VPVNTLLSWLDKISISADEFDEESGGRGQRWGGRRGCSLLLVGLS
jgi:hypothetical protein